MCPLASSHSLAFTGIRLVKPRVSPRFPHSARIKNYLGWQTKCWFVLMFVLINQLSPPAWLQLQGQEVMSWRAMQSLIKTNTKSFHKFTLYFHILVPHFEVDKAYFSHYELWLFNIFNVWDVLKYPTSCKMRMMWRMLIVGPNVFWNIDHYLISGREWTNKS